MFNVSAVPANEKIIKVINQHKFILFTKLTLPILLMAALFFFLPLILRWQKIGIFLFLIVYIILILIVFKIIFIWKRNKCYVTDKKIIDIDQKGLLKKTVSETTLENVIDISYELNGLFQNILNYGNLYVVIAQGTSKILLRNVPQPAILQNLLQDLIKNTKTNLSK